MFFLQRKVKYAGHEVSQNGIETDPDKIKVKSWSTLTTFEPSQFLCLQNIAVNCLKFLHNSKNSYFNACCKEVNTGQEMAVGRC